MGKIILYNDDFIPWPGWKIYKKNSKIENFDLDLVREFWQKCRTTDVCSLFDSGNEDQVPFNLSVLIQLMRENLIPADWKKYLADSLPSKKEATYVNIQIATVDSATIRFGDNVKAFKQIPIQNVNTRVKEDSWESIAFVGTVYLNHNGNPCVPALYMKPNEQLDIRYIYPKEMLSNNGSALAHVHGFRDRNNNLPSTIAYGMINL